MSVFTCATHGIRIGEQVSHSVKSAMSDAERAGQELIPVTVAFDDMWLPSHIGTWEKQDFEHRFGRLDGLRFFHVDSHEKFEEFLATITPVCLDCLKAFQGLED